MEGGMSTKEKDIVETKVESLTLMCKIARVHGRVEGIIMGLKYSDMEFIEKSLRKVARELGEIQKLERSNRLDFPKT
jgi:hypothetical protein